MSNMRQNIKRAYIAFGANLSNPRATLMDVVRALGEAGIIIDAVSNLWRSKAWPPGSGAPDYQNAVLSVRTEKSASELMTLLLQIEVNAGRVRTVKNAPRPCDLDLIDYAGEVVEDDFCHLPHPRFQDRDFVLLPLAEVVEPNWAHPITGQTIEDLLEALDAA